ncbi:unnamed protein product, partial [Prorocentrum cordatum]
AEDPGGPVDDAGEEEDARAGEVDTSTAAEPPLEVDARVRDLVQKVHVNLGPGMVIYQYNNTAWVSMRSRLWKCASEQLRPATGPEARGAELLSDPGVSELVRQAPSNNLATVYVMDGYDRAWPRAFCQRKAEWMQLLFQDAVFGAVIDECWQGKVGPFASLLRKDCTLNTQPTNNLAIVDAKGIFDTLDRDTGGSKNDRRVAIDLSVCRESLSRLGGTIRWMPRPFMPVDVMTKADVSKGNAAQLQLLKTGMMRLTAEKDSITHRRQDPSSKA